MVTTTSFVLPLLLVHGAYGGMTAALLRAVSRANEIESAHALSNAAAATIDAFDNNHDGHVEASEVAAFAQKEGLDKESATDDFSGLDTNGDGVLDAAELLQVLQGGPPVNATAADKDHKAAPKTKAEAKVHKSVPKTKTTFVATEPIPQKSLQHIVQGLAAQKPTTKHEPRISIQHKQEAHPAHKLAMEKSPVIVHKAPEPVQIAKDQAVQLPKHQQFQHLVKVSGPSPTERMAKHFAKVLRNAEIITGHDATLKLAKHYVTPAAGYQHDDVQRVSVVSAAKEVAEQLFIAETAEGSARVLDRKAAEERANATVLAKITTQEALNAGAAAAHKRANELLAGIAKFEDEAERAQVRAAALHSKAKLETEEASELMEVADSALNHPSARKRSMEGERTDGPNKPASATEKISSAVSS